MDARMTPYRGHIITVRGPVRAEDMGVTLPHEHLLIDHETPMTALTDPQTARAECQRFTTYGGSTIIELTCWGMGRNPVGLRQAAEWASMNVVMGTGPYKEGWLPPEIQCLSVDEMAALMVREIVEGADGTGIRAGVIGEVGVSSPITPTEERGLAAAARAQQATGVAINVHLEMRSAPQAWRHVLDVLEANGADLNRVILSHFMCRPDEEPLCRELAARGAYVEFDLFGQEQRPNMAARMQTPPIVQIASLAWFMSAGLVDHILISQNICHPNQLRVRQGYGYAHILRDLVPRFREFGVTDEQIHTMTVDNPRRVFPVQNGRNERSGE